MKKNLFDISEKVILITGGGGVLGGSMAAYLLEQGASVIILSRKEDTINRVVSKLKAISDKVSGYVCDVTKEKALLAIKDTVISVHKKIDILINAAGGNMPGATIREDQTVFDVNIDHFRKVVDLNLFGSIIPALVFGEEMAKNKKGLIINISSMAADRVITRVVGYSASKAAIENFTRWMSVELALKFGEGLRVNAIAPGFFIGNQNRSLLTKEDGSYTERGNTIINNTPMKRFGEAEELNGTIHYLCSEASKFVTGIVMPIDGGFSAFSGV